MRVPGRLLRKVKGGSREGSGGAQKALGGERFDDGEGKPIYRQTLRKSFEVFTADGR